MKITTLCTAIAAAFFGLSSATLAGPADNSVYATAFVGLQGGGNLTTEAGGMTASADLASGIAGGATLGYGIPNPLGIQGSLRPEAEVSMRKGDIEITGDSVETLTFFANAWYDLPTTGPLTPYLGGGVGAGRVSLNSENDTRLAWQAGGGVHFDLGGDIFVGANYRYVRANATLFSTDLNTDGHQITASIGIPLN